MNRQFTENQAVVPVAMGDLSAGYDPNANGAGNAEFMTLAYHDHFAVLIAWEGTLAAKLSILQATGVTNPNNDAKPIPGLRRVYIGAKGSDFFWPVERAADGSAKVVVVPEAGPPSAPVGPTDLATPNVPFMPPLATPPLNLGAFHNDDAYELPGITDGRVIVEFDAEDLDTNGTPIYHAIAPFLEAVAGGSVPAASPAAQMTVFFTRPRYLGSPDEGTRSVFEDPTQ